MVELNVNCTTGVSGEYVVLDGEDYFRIAHCHLMPDFFMSIVGASDHWMFVSSNGSLTAGRRNPDHALFPYASDDQISIGRSNTGSLTFIRVAAPGIDRAHGIWQPFSAVAAEAIRCNVYKNPLGNKVIFEEVNETLGLTFRYRWAFSQRFGFVRSCRLENHGDNFGSFHVLDGLQNLLPHGIDSEFHLRFSNLANAYKKNELLDNSRIGVFYLSSIPTDKAEPSEGLKATVAWQTGLDAVQTLISQTQIQAFQNGAKIRTEADVRGRAAAYLTHFEEEIGPGDAREWHVVADLDMDHSAIVALHEWLMATPDASAEIAADIARTEEEFVKIVASSDGIQCGANRRRVNRHLSNTVFNVMRGGIPLQNYSIPTDDFRNHIAKFNRQVANDHAEFLDRLPEQLSTSELQSKIAEIGDPSLTRLGMEYLPLAFSRRHGDPTRPWNRFSIDLVDENGKSSLNYQGNWRDIFQNWEALGVSFPEFTTAMICRFVNATTADGYNPYRVTKDGFHWEEPAPDDPWANIGYWGDHQIIYLLKLLEWTRRFSPEGIDDLLDRQIFTHANVPYRIKSYDDICKTPRDTIVFDHAANEEIRVEVVRLGTDGKFLQRGDNKIHHVTLVEKLMTLSLAKLSNFVPDGGIWLNTQRPEWNDANNALVGNGLSMVTTCYLYRWFTFIESWMGSVAKESFTISSEVADFFANIAEVLQSNSPSTDTRTDAAVRKNIVDALSSAGCKYRRRLYEKGMTGSTTSVAKEAVLALCASAKDHLQATIRNNRRSDGLYHSYNLIELGESKFGVQYLYEMLEGQVAILSSGLLTSSEAVELLDRLRGSGLYRKNQDSYLLYPDRKLPRFLEKNCLNANFVASNELVRRLLADGNDKIIKRDVLGGVHFAGDFRNSGDLMCALHRLADSNPEYAPLIHQESEALRKEFEDIFAHRQFTGRSGTFFAYEGLGSIYWHMVSKLALAVVENYFAALEQGADQKTMDALAAHFQAIRRGIGAEKSPQDYGAFPTDPYSHTPEDAGVKQPGMTGQVKEDILSRFAEIGIHVLEGCLHFRTELFDHDELLKTATHFEYRDLAGNPASIDVPAGGFAFTAFQVPFVYQSGESDEIVIHLADGSESSFTGKSLDPETSQTLFSRCGKIESVRCSFADL